MRLHSIVVGKTDEWNKYVYSLVYYQKGVCNKKDLFCSITCSVLQTIVMETWVYGSLGSMHYYLKTRCSSVMMVKVNSYCGLIFYLIKVYYMRWYIAGPQIFQKSWRHLKILCSGEVTWNNFHTEDPQILDDTVCNLLTWLAWHPEYVQSCGTSICP